MHLENAKRLSNAPYRLGWLIRPLWPPHGKLPEPECTHDFF